MSVIEAIEPVTHVFQLFGLSVVQFSTFKNSPIRCVINHYPLLLIAIRFSLFCYVSIKYQLTTDDDNFISAINVIIIISAHLLEIVILIETFVKACAEQMFMENFQKIDDILFQNFGVDLKFNKSRKSVVKRLVIWICIVGIESSYHLLMHSNAHYFPHELICTLSFFTASLMYFQIITWTDLIGYRLRIVIRLINELKFTHNEENIRKKLLHEGDASYWQMIRNNRIGNTSETNDIVDDTHIFDQLCLLCDLYNRLWTQTNLLNERFKFSMVLSIGTDFAYLILQLYFIFMCFRKFEACDFFPTDFSLCVINILRLSMLSRAGQIVTDDAIQIAFAIHRNKITKSNTKISLFVSGIRLENLRSVSIFKKDIRITIILDSTIFVSIASPKSKT